MANAISLFRVRRGLKEQAGDRFIYYACPRRVLNLDSSQPLTRDDIHQAVSKYFGTCMQGNRPVRMQHHALKEFPQLRGNCSTAQLARCGLCCCRMTLEFCYA